MLLYRINRDGVGLVILASLMQMRREIDGISMLARILLAVTYDEY